MFVLIESSEIWSRFILWMFVSLYLSESRLSVTLILPNQLVIHVTCCYGNIPLWIYQSVYLELKKSSAERSWGTWICYLFNGHLSPEIVSHFRPEKNQLSSFSVYSFNATFIQLRLDINLEDEDSCPQTFRQDNYRWETLSRPAADGVCPVQHLPWRVLSF